MKENYRMRTTEELKTIFLKSHNQLLQNMQRQATEFAEAMLNKDESVAKARYVEVKNAADKILKENNVTAEELEIIKAHQKEWVKDVMQDVLSVLTNQMKGKDDEGI